MWLTGVLVIDNPMNLSFIIQILVVVLLISILWFILRRIIPSVFLNPDNPVA
jgi:hypothetical protein